SASIRSRCSTCRLRRSRRCSTTTSTRWPPRPRRWSGEGRRMNVLSSILPALPEILLALGAMALLMLGAYREGSTQLVNLLAILLLIAAAFITASMPNGGGFGGSFVVDDFARFLKILVYIGSAFAIVLSIDFLAQERQQIFEYSVLILLSTVGMGMLISAA